MYDVENRSKTIFLYFIYFLRVIIHVPVLTVKMNAKYFNSYVNKFKFVEGRYM